MWTITHTGNAGTYDVEKDGVFVTNFKFLADAAQYVHEQENL